MILHYLKTACRQLARHKTRSIISILGLAVGMACFSISNYLVRALYEGDSCFSTYDRMAGVFSRYDDRQETASGNYKYSQAGGPAITQFLQMQFDEIEAVATYSSSEEANLEVNFSDSLASRYRASMIEANGDFFKVYPVDVVEGSTQSFATRPDAAVITRSFAKRLAAKGELIGKSITLSSYRNRKMDGAPRTYTIVGVVEDFPLWTSITSHEKREVFFRESDPSASPSNISLLLKPGVDVQSINNQLRQQRFGIDGNKNQRLEVHYYSTVRTVNKGLLILSFIGFLVLLTGVINFLNFTLGSFLNRSRELSLRRVVGASTWQQFLQLATELTIVLLVTVLGSTALLEVGLTQVMNIMFRNNKIATSIEAGNLILHQVEYCAILFLVCMVMAYITIWRTRRISACVGIKGGNSTGRKHRLRNTMLGVQCLICILFLLGIVGGTMQAIYSNKSLPEKNAKDPERILSMYMRGENELEEHYEEIMQYLHASDWQELTALRSWSTATMQNGNGSIWVDMDYVTPDYFRIMNFPVQVGEGEEAFCFVNRKLNALLEKNSLYNIVAEGINYPVTGTIDYEDGRRDHTAFVPFRCDEKPDIIYVKVKKGRNMQEVRSQLTEKIQSYLPEGVTLNIYTLKENLSTMEAWDVVGLCAVCAVVCLLITVLGIYGAITLDTDKRQKEVAIRKINGAGIKHIIWLFGRLYVCLFGISALLGCFIAFAFLTFMSQHVNGIFNYKSPCFWGLALLIEATVIVCTIGYRIYRISRSNPADVIKNDNK